MTDNSADNSNDQQESVPKASVQQESVLNASVSDQAAESDSLGFEPYVTAIAEFLTNPVTQPPLTISIEGAWGSGKSSLMKQLQKEIEDSEQKKFKKELNKDLGEVKRKLTTFQKAFSEFLEYYYKPYYIGRIIKFASFICVTLIVFIINIYKLSRLNINKLKPKPRTVWFNAWRHDKAEALWAAFALEFLRKISTPRSVYDTIPTFIGHIKLLFLRFKFQSGWLDLIRMIAQLVIGLCAIALIVIFSLFQGPSWVQQLSQNISNLNVRLEQTHKHQEKANNASSQNSNNQPNTKNSSLPQNLSNQGSSNNTNQENPYSLPVGVGGIGASVLATISLWQQLRKLVGDPKKALIQYLKSPDYNNQVAFVEKFHEDFKKIVDAYAGADKKVYVFIDDLDRCELPKAADLMQALNLMISNDPHIIFILGMDREKVAAGLAVKYKDILPYLPLSSIATDEKNKNNRNSRLSGMEYGYSFLEKFIQIPFQVPQPTNYDFQKFLKQIAPVQAENKSVFSQITSVITRVIISVITSINVHLSLAYRNISRDAPTSNRTEPTPNSTKETSKETNLQRRQRLKINVTEDSQTITDIVIMVASALDNNPRRLKQFLNLFRLKTYIASNTGLFDEVFDKSQNKPNEPLTLEQLGKFTAICVKWPQLLIDLETDRDLLKNLQKFALHMTHESKNLQKFALHMTHESDEYNDLTQEWGTKPKLVELLRYPQKLAGTTPNKYILEEKYSLENVAIDKLLLVSPGTQDDLTSETGIDYTKLRDLLAAENWKEADDETYQVMLQAVNREIGDWIRPKELLNFPCTDLRTIDSLWVKYSNGRFGFSVQKKIYLEVGGKLDGNLDQEVWQKFGVRLGWRMESNINWIELSKVTYDTKAPPGHLPLSVMEKHRWYEYEYEKVGRCVFGSVFWRL